MKKKIVLKKWVERVLLIILFGALLVTMTECENTMLFALTHIISGAIAVVIGLILVSYGRESD